jgi:hypothetical protein
VVFQRFAGSLSKGLAAMDLPSGVRELLWSERGRLAAIPIPRSLPHQLHSGLEQLVASAFVDAFRTIMLISAGLAVAASLVAWLVIGASPASAERRGLTPRDCPDSLLPGPVSRSLCGPRRIGRQFGCRAQAHPSPHPGWLCRR